ncbi:MAG: NMD3-related protein [Thermoplasmata archaeon]
MVDSEFCVVCGRTGRPLVEGVCPECAADRLPLLSPPGRGVVVLCPTCGARKIGSHWERADTAAVLTHEDLDPLLSVHPEVAIRSIRWEETQVSALLHEFRGVARVRFRGTERTVELPLTVKVEHRTCPDCSRKSGHYYTAVLQLRGAIDGPREKPPELRSRLERQWEELMREARPDWRKAVSWREALPEGWDLYVVDTLAARSIARLAKQRFGAKLKESATLVGRKDGNDLYRVTFCLRLARPAASG